MDITCISDSSIFQPQADLSEGYQGGQVPRRKCLRHSRNTLDTFIGTQKWFGGVFGKTEIFMNFMLDLHLKSLNKLQNASR